MNVLILPAWYPNKKDYVAGIFVKQQVKALQSVGIKPVVYYPYDSEVLPNKLNIEVEDKVKIYRANTEYGSNHKLSKIISYINAIRNLRRIIKENNIDIIHTHVAYPAGIVSYMSYLLNKKVPYVLTEHRSNVKEFADRFYNNILKKVYFNAKKVITVSEFLQKELRSLGYNFSGVVIGNVIDISNEEVYNKEIKDCINILFIGSMGLNEVKGIKYLIPALEKFIKNTSLKVKVTFIGDGTYKNNYVNLSKELGIEENCKFVGRIPNSEIGSYIKNSHFLVSSSIKETFGAVIIESMSYGRPVLATKCGGPNEIINEINGMLVESRSVDSLYDGLNKMVINYSNFSSKDIKDYVKANYSLYIIGNELKKVYEEILK